MGRLTTRAGPQTKPRRDAGLQLRSSWVITLQLCSDLQVWLNHTSSALARIFQPISDIRYSTWR
jgi:hypothetical protein